MSATVWVVEEGEYSDYHVVGVFASEADARYVADVINGPGEDMHEKATVAEWPLNPAVNELRQGYLPHVVLMLGDGTVERIHKEDVSGYDLGGSVRIWRRSQAPAYRGTDIKDALQATVWAKDDAHAIKITNEHRARLIASGEWVP